MKILKNKTKLTAFFVFSTLILMSGLYFSRSIRLQAAIIILPKTQNTHLKLVPGKTVCNLARDDGNGEHIIRDAINAGNPQIWKNAFDNLDGNFPLQTGEKWGIRAKRYTCKRPNSTLNGCEIRLNGVNTNDANDNLQVVPDASNPGVQTQLYIDSTGTEGIFMNDTGISNFSVRNIELVGFIIDFVDNGTVNTRIIDNFYVKENGVNTGARVAYGDISASAISSDGAGNTYNIAPDNRDHNYAAEVDLQESDVLRPAQLASPQAANPYTRIQIRPFSEHNSQILWDTDDEFCLAAVYKYNDGTGTPELGNDGKDNFSFDNTGNIVSESGNITGGVRPRAIAAGDCAVVRRAPVSRNHTQTFTLANDCPAGHNNPDYYAVFDKGMTCADPGANLHVWTNDTGRRNITFSRTNYTDLTVDCGNQGVRPHGGSAYTPNNYYYIQCCGIFGKINASVQRFEQNTQKAKVCIGGAVPVADTDCKDGQCCKQVQADDWDTSNHAAVVFDHIILTPGTNAETFPIP